MAALNAIAREWADELREGIAWVIVWKTGRSWNAQAVWLNCDDDTFEPEDLELARKVLEQDPNAVMLNGYYCGHFGEDMTAAELAAGIRWHYENGYNTLDGSTAFPAEPEPRPEDDDEDDEIPPSEGIWMWTAGLKTTYGEILINGKGGDHMAKSTPYRTCPHCGSNLDWGERCTCQDGKLKDATPEAAKSAGQLATGKKARNLREPVLMPGA